MRTSLDIYILEIFLHVSTYIPLPQFLTAIPTQVVASSVPTNLGHGIIANRDESVNGNKQKNWNNWLSNNYATTNIILGMGT